LGHFGAICHSLKASVFGSFVRHSSQVLGGIEDEIPSAYSIRINFGVFQLMKKTLLNSTG